MSGVLLPWANSPRLGLVGNPENRRIRDFQHAVEALGWPRPACLAYEDLLQDPECRVHLASTPVAPTGSRLYRRVAPGGRGVVTGCTPECLRRFDVDLLRVDSPGENERVAKALIALGGGPALADLEFGEIRFLREYHRGFCAVLEWIEQRGISCLNAPRDIGVMFDKWACHQRFVEQGVGRPPSELAPIDFPSLLGRMRAQGSGRLFLKPLHGSSASGVCALRWTRHRQQLIAPLRIQSRGGQPILVNSLKVCTYTSLADLELILGILLPQGMILEQWIPKLTLPGGALDLRVLVIAGEARHWVIRQSRHPMTNLHLGNQRGDAAALRELIGPARLEAAFQLAEKAAACFPDSLYAGVDILLDSRHRPLVGEINAFGDLLPRLIHRGESAYSAIAKACYAKDPSPQPSPHRMGRGRRDPSPRPSPHPMGRGSSIEQKAASPSCAI